MLIVVRITVIMLGKILKECRDDSRDKEWKHNAGYYVLAHCLGTTVTIHSFIPGQPEVRVMQVEWKGS